MKKYFLQTQVFIFLTILLFSTACKGQVKKDLSKEKVSESNILSVAHPKLIKTIGNPRGGNVQCILQDKAGNLWFGTTQNGLYKYDGKSFTQFLVADGLDSNSVYSLLEDKEGKIWIGTEAGLCLYDGKTFTEIPIPLPKNLPPNNHPSYRNLHWVYSMVQSKSGKLWFVTIDGVYSYDGKSFTLFNIPEAANSFLTTNDKAERIFEDKGGNIWFGGRTNKGAYHYNGKSVSKFELEDLFQDGPKPKAHNWAWPQLQDKVGNIWFSNWGGAYRYDGKSFTSFTKKDGLLNNNIWSILEDKTGNIWVGTRETGLYLYNGKTFLTYSEYKD